MPIYGYECQSCGHHFEVFRNISDPPLADCPECGGPIRKLLYPVGVIFKGSGFYSTDYKGSKSTSSNGSSSSSSSESSKSEGSKDSGGGTSEPKSSSGGDGGGSSD